MVLACLSPARGNPCDRSCERSDSRGRSDQYFKSSFSESGRTASVKVKILRLLMGQILSRGKEVGEQKTYDNLL